MSDLRTRPPATLATLAALLRSGETSSRALVEQALERATRKGGEGTRAFTRLYAEQAIAAARESDSRFVRGAPRSPLEGLPISIKDLCDVAGEPTTAGAIALSDAEPAARDAAIVRNLRQAGAVIVGKTNMTEFAYSGLGLNPHYGNPRSPWQREQGRIAGGSSSGAAVSVADGMAVAAIGSDTGGSIRIPAAFCDLVGFKPTARRVPREGCFDLSATLDSLGPLARTVECCRQVDAVLAGAPIRPLSPGRRWRLGLAPHYMLDGCDDTVTAAYERALVRLERAGAELVPLPVDALQFTNELVSAGSFGNLEGWNKHGEMLTRIADRMDPRVHARFVTGKDAAPGQLDELRRIRAELIRRFGALVDGLDAIVGPTVPIVPPREAELDDYADYVRLNALILRNTAVANFVDGSAITIPCGEPGGAPVGLGFTGPSGSDAAILSVAEWAEGVLGRAPA
jgi:aspartyl-tRNA(Asn)/glutamyl-tRNA(Gln) amidotransferase subunit A